MADAGQVGTAFVELHYRLDSLQRDLGAVTSTVNSQMRRVGASAEAAVPASLGRRLTAPFQSLNAKLRETVAGFGGLRGVIAGIGLAAAAKSAIDATRAFERINTTLTFATGSASAASKEYEFIRSASERLGLSLESTAQSYASFIAAAKGTAIEGEQARQVFLGISEAAATLQLAPDAFEGALTALQQMVSKGTVASEELRGQLGERLPGAFQIAARAMGYGTDEIGKFVKQLELGAVSSAVFLPRFAQELRKTFGEGAEKAARGATAEFNRFSSALFEIKVAFGNSGFLSGLIDGLNSVRDVLADPATQQGMAAFGSFVGETISYLVAHSREIGVALAAFAGLKAGASVGGALAGGRGAAIGGAVGGITGAAAAMLAMSEQADAAGRSVEDLRAEFAELNAKLLEFESSPTATNNPALPAVRNHIDDMKAQLDELLRQIAEAAAQAEDVKAEVDTTATSALPSIAAPVAQVKTSKVDKAREAVEGARQEAEAQKRLALAYGEGEAAVREVTIALEAEQTARAAGISLGSAAFETLKAEIAARAEYERGIDSTQAKLEAQEAFAARLVDAEDDLALARLEAATSGQAGSEAIVAARRAEIEVTKAGISATSELGQRYIETARSVAEVRAGADANQQAIDDYADALSDAEYRGQQFGDTITGSLEQSLFAFDSLGASLTSLAEDLARLIVRMTIMEPLARSIGAAFTGAFAPAPAGGGGGGGGGSTGGGALFAHGGAFSQGRLMAFAKGGAFGRHGIVSKPTLFPMARGAGLMGEAGPEAVLPLKRGRDGKLGVSADAGEGGGGISVDVQVIDQRTSSGSAPVEVERGTGAGGKEQIRIMVRDAVRSEIRSGGLNTAMRQQFGVRPGLNKV